LLLRAICEEAEVANPHETIREDVEQEATDELIRLKRHWPKSIGVSSIAIRESDAALIQREDAIVDMARGEYSGRGNRELCQDRERLR
jgi:hypothetical protein